MPSYSISNKTYATSASVEHIPYLSDIAVTIIVSATYSMTGKLFDHIVYLYTKKKSKNRSDLPEPNKKNSTVISIAPSEIDDGLDLDDLLKQHNISREEFEKMLECVKLLENQYPDNQFKIKFRLGKMYIIMY